MSVPVVEATGLGRRFGYVHALRGVDLAIRAGEGLTVFGPNGAGKTTLLRILAGILRPTIGSLRVFGKDRPDVEVRRRIGVVSHGSFLYGDLTARENLELHARLFGLRPVREKVESALEGVGLERWRDRLVGGFSRGMEQRLALARAFLHDPELVLLDEPYSGLDFEAVGRLQEILLRAHASGRTLVLTTHDIGHALEVCDRAIVLAGGRVVWSSGRFLPGAREMRTIYEREVRASRRG